MPTHVGAQAGRSKGPKLYAVAHDVDAPWIYDTWAAAQPNCEHYYNRNKSFLSYDEAFLYLDQQGVLEEYTARLDAMMDASTLPPALMDAWRGHCQRLAATNTGSDTHDAPPV